MRIEVVGRQDVEHRDLRHFARVIESQAMRHPAAAVVADDRELVEAEVLHHLDLIERHRALRVVAEVRRVRHLAAVAVAAQVGCNDGTASPAADRRTAT